ncbi:MAG: chemotaxis protein CheW [Candidatus Theseobacter exili]|nr:chemotaxis protein CheW [Candidatus Theseobacter exili]
MDRSIQTEINESLLHLLKNAVTHGIESAKEREKLNKPDRARIKLVARREKEFVIVEISDDGRGIDIEEVKKTTLARGIITAEELSTLAPEEIVMLITHPGYSGAKKVTEAAGRGVGLNAVRVKVESFGGTLSIDTRVNKGTIFFIKLPLTMAVIQVLLVGIANETYCIPLSHIHETIKISTQEIRTVEHHEMVSHRNTVIPLIRLKEKLGFHLHNGQNHTENERKGEIDGRIPVIVVETGTKKTGLIVENIIGQQDAIIKPLAGILKKIKGVSGATILGTGKVVFIVDVPSVV